MPLQTQLIGIRKAVGITNSNKGGLALEEGRGSLADSVGLHAIER
jgi:hypothetical protein